MNSFDVLIFIGKSDTAFEMKKISFEKINEALNFIKEKNSKYDKNSKYWEIYVFCNEVIALEFSREFLEEWL